MNCNKNDLAIIIQDLILSKKENDFYDFKREWYKDNNSLIHDIICMANVITHEGDRFIIIGVDNKYNIRGVDNDLTRKDQEKVICILKDCDFNGDYRPDIELQTITLEEKTIDVLIIKDKPFKPYLLKKTKKGNPDKNSKDILPAIYTRTGDTNTSIDSSADYNLIEKMFEERFGLNKNPLSRMISYLLDYQNWKSIDYVNDENVTQYFYTKFPEFTIKYFDDGQETRKWSEKDILGKPFNSHVVEYLYHSTVLYRSFALVSKDAHLCFSRPTCGDSFHFSNPEDRESLNPDKNVPYFVYYNYKDTIECNVKYLLENMYGVSSGLHQKDDYRFIDFNDEDEKNRFFEPENQRKVFKAFFSSGHKKKQNNSGAKENYEIEREFRIFAWEYYENNWRTE